MTGVSQLEVLLSVAIAMLLGGMIGLERELKDRPAGFRTHMLVAAAAALLIGVGQLALADSELVEMPTRWLADPLRLVQAVIAGVAFIGAGTIFGRRGDAQVEGITTAASLLMVAVIGTAAGFQYYLVALATTVLTLLVLVVLKLVERKLKARRGSAGKSG